jgi:hypothetical protein
MTQNGAVLKTAPIGIGLENGSNWSRFSKKMLHFEPFS